MADPKDNLRPPWKPGESGNPNGRPKERPIAAELRKLLERDDGAALKALAAIAIKAALKGDYRWGRELLDRIDGKVVEQHDVTSKGESVRPGYADLPDELKAQVAKALGGPE